MVMAIEDTFKDIEKVKELTRLAEKVKGIAESPIPPRNNMPIRVLRLIEYHFTSLKAYNDHMSKTKQRMSTTHMRMQAVALDPEWIGENLTSDWRDIEEDVKQAEESTQAEESVQFDVQAEIQAEEK